MNKRIDEMSRARGALSVAALVAVLWAGTAYAQQANSNSTGSQKDTSDTPHLEFVFEEFVTLGASIHPGETPFGERNIVPITGGTFSGPNIRGKVMSGGWDWQLATKTGCHSIQADYMIQADDGAIINVINKGTSCAGPGANVRLFTTPTFEAPLGTTRLAEWWRVRRNAGARHGRRKAGRTHSILSSEVTDIRIRDGCLASAWRTASGANPACRDFSKRKKHKESP